MNWLDGVDVVSLDAGGTLLDPWPSVGGVYARAAAGAGFGEFPEDGLQRAFVAAWRGRGGFDHSRAGWAALVRSTFAGFTEAAGDAALFDAVYSAFERPDAWRIFPDAIRFLEGARRRGLRCVVVSNWDERLVPLTRAMGLAGSFEFVLASVEAGVAKPGRGIFDAARDRCGVDAGRMLHVGDSWREDVEGAVAAGWRAVWLDRDGSAPPRGPRVTALDALLGAGK